MSTLTPHVNSGQAADFEQEVRVVFQGVKEALTELLTSVGADPMVPQEVSRRFGLDKNLTWKISRVLKSADAGAAIPNMPGKPGLQRLMQSMKAAGAPAAAFENAERALEAFDLVVRTHGGDRETFQMMLGVASPETAIQQAEATRKLSFRGNSGTWGIQARAQISAHLIAPSAVAERLDFAIISGLTELRRLRPDVPWAVATVAFIGTGGLQHGPLAFEPIADEIDATGAPLMREFCSENFPPLRVVQEPGVDLRRFELAEGPIGATAAVTCVTGRIHRAAVNMFADNPDDAGEHIVNFTTPAEFALHDLYVHRSLKFAHHPELFLYSQLAGGLTVPTKGRARSILNVPERMLALGSPPDLTSAEVPSFGRMIRKAMAKLGHAEGDFVGFRFRLRYPPIPTAAMYRYALPTR